MLLIRLIGRKTRKAVLFAGCILQVVGCTTTGELSGVGPVTASGSRIETCKSTDQQVASQAQCLLDDAACYQLSNGNWCTGERGNTCPAGSTALPAGTDCPAGRRCIALGESLECMI